MHSCLGQSTRHLSSTDPSDILLATAAFPFFLFFSLTLLLNHNNWSFLLLRPAKKKKKNHICLFTTRETLGDHWPVVSSLASGLLLEWPVGDMDVGEWVFQGFTLEWRRSGNGYLLTYHSEEVKKKKQLYRYGNVRLHEYHELHQDIVLYKDWSHSKSQKTLFVTKVLNIYCAVIGNPLYVYWRNKKNPTGNKHDWKYLF